jgi:hypothetical protein
MNPDTAAWANFFVAEVGASAALTGLLVVAISINLSRILSSPPLPGRAAEALITLVAAFVLTSIWLVPNQPGTVFGAEVLTIGLITFLASAGIQLRSLGLTEGVSLPKRFARAAMTTMASILFVAGGVLLLSNASAGLYWVAAGVIASLVGSVWNAWVLLIEILR